MVSGLVIRREGDAVTLTTLEQVVDRKLVLCVARDVEYTQASFADLVRRRCVRAHTHGMFQTQYAHGMYQTHVLYSSAILRSTCECPPVPPCLIGIRDSSSSPRLLSFAPRHTYIVPRVCVCMFKCVCVFKCVCSNVCMCVRAHAAVPRVCVCVCSSVCVCSNVCLCARAQLRHRPS
jgi:hypothetical protein